MSAALAGILALGLVAAAPASAQTTGSTGFDQGGSDKELRQLIDEITKQVDRAEKERLADPWWLRDLRNVLAKYDYPWQKRLFSDDFSGRGPGPDAPWQVTAGEMLIDWRYGLRSVISPRYGTTDNSQTNEDQQVDPVKQLFGQILQQTLQGGQNTQSGTSRQASYAAAKLPVPISNAFAMALDISARPPNRQGATRLEIGPYVGANAAHGYRLVYNGSGQTPSLEVLQLSSRGTRTLYVHDKPINLEDNQVHKFLWTRDRGGAMKIALNGQVLFEVIDRGYVQTFDGFAVVNAAGDFALRTLIIDGTE